MAKKLFFLLVLLGIGAILVFYRAQTTISVKGHELKVTIADSDEERIRGLSGRDSLGENEGILFIFEASAYYQFWMKDMQFPIDIIWIDENKIIVDIAEKVTPDTYPRLFTPAKPAKYVIEVNAGWVDNSEIEIGDSVVL